MATLHDDSCIFCRIAAGKIPCHKVYEDDQILAFLDIGPIVRGHTLVIPKSHCTNVMDVSPELNAAIAAKIPALARAVTAAVNAPACHVLTNCNPQASQSVMHLHYHILPRFDGDKYKLPWPAGKLEIAEAQDLLTRVKNNLKV